VERIVGADLTLTSSGQSITIPSAVLRGWVHLVPSSAPGQWEVVIPQEPIAQYVDQLKRVVDVAPVNASFTLKGRHAAVVEGQDGQQIDPAPAVSAVVEALNARAEATAAGAPSSVDFSVVPVTPEFTGADAAAIADRVKRLGSWTTHFTVSPFNGNGVNIQRPARLVNGTVVQPAEMFDFIDVAGPFNRGNGYTDGAAIQGGRTKLDGVLGGGLCSASTTLFNAAARAGFQIDERHNHSYYITRYPVGLDATIWMNGSIRKSFRFTNDTAYPILIRGYYSPGRVTFEIWGVPDGRTVKFSRADVEGEKPGQNFVEYTDSLPPGKTEHVEFKATGFESTVVRTVRDASGNVIHEDTFFSDYIKVDGIYRVGRYPGDPRAGTRIPASEYVRSGP
jgi:vancomycin resistance protein YoaR